MNTLKKVKLLKGITDDLQDDLLKLIIEMSNRLTLETAVYANRMYGGVRGRLAN